MPLPIVGGLFAWLLGLVGSTATAVFTWVVARQTFTIALHYARVTAFVITAGALFLAVSLTIKAAIFAARVAMPSSLGMATYFLPGNINSVLAIFVVVRVSAAVYAWTLRNIKIYTGIETGKLM